MINIKYRLTSSPFFGGEALVLSETESGLHDLVRFELGGIRNGMLELNGKTYAVTDSQSFAKYEDLPEGTITPTVTVGKKSICAAPLFKSKGGISAASTPAEYEKLLSHLLDFEKRLDACENRVKELSDSVCGHTLFNFIET